MNATIIVPSGQSTGPITPQRTLQHSPHLLPSLAPRRRRLQPEQTGCRGPSPLQAGEIISTLSGLSGLQSVVELSGLQSVVELVANNLASSAPAPLQPAVTVLGGDIASLLALSPSGPGIARLMVRLHHQAPPIPPIEGLGYGHA